LETSDNLLALGELRGGVAKQTSNFIYLNADLAVGCGIVSDGRVTRGAQGAAGNIGHITVGGDALCHCGRRGCLEAVAGGEALLKEAEAAGASGDSPYFADVIARSSTIDIRDLAEGVRQGDETSQRLVAMAGTTVGRALGATINVLNPSMVVAGGCLPQLGDLFLASMREAIYRHSLPFVTRDLSIVVVQHTERTGLQGAAQMVVDQVFAPKTLARWFPGRPTPAVHAAQ
ncbi:MAG: ROK family protein, partial [Alphaproteobacteria bacterium]